MRQNLWNQPKQVDSFMSKRKKMSKMNHNFASIIKQNNNIHVEELIQLSDDLLERKEELKLYFSRIPLYANPSVIQKDLVKKLKIHPLMVDEVMKQYFWTNHENQKVFDFLHSHNVIIRAKFQRGSYELVLMMSPEMRDNFDKFGDVLNLSFHFVPIKRNGLMRTQYVGLFSGVTDVGVVSIFAISILVGSTPQFKQIILSQFLSMISPLRPFTIISEISPPIKKALQKYSNQHSFNISLFENKRHTIERARLSLMNEEATKDIVILLERALKTSNKEETVLLLNRIIKNTSRTDPRAIMSYLRETQSCMSCKSPNFVGFETEAGRLSSLIETVNEEFPYCPKLGNFLIRSLYLERKLSKSSEKLPYLSNLSNFYLKYCLIPTQQLKILSQNMKEEIFQKLVHQYAVSTKKCTAHRTQHPLKLIINLSSQEEEENSDLRYEVKYDLSHDCWSCQCNLLCWSGIPCAHLITVVMEMGGSLLYYVNSRWYGKDPYHIMRRSMSDSIVHHDQERREQKQLNSNEDTKRKEKILNLLNKKISENKNCNNEALERQKEVKQFKIAKDDEETVKFRSKSFHQRKNEPFDQKLKNDKK